MKAYILYIATLLAALALPATAQNGGTGTKTAPDKPAMPYKLTTVTIGDNNGTMEVKDAKEGGNGVITVENDTLAYGAYGNNATTVKLTATPNDGYTIRKGYPKAYKTDNSSSTITVTESKFAMPPFPVTVEIAYAHKLDSIADITLKESKQTADEVIAILPRYVHIILAGGRKDSLPVSKWTYDASKNNGSNDAHNNGGTDGAYNTADGAVNVFSFTLAALPDSIDANGKLTNSEGGDGKYTGTAKVANMAKPLVPTDTDKGIIISGGTGDNLNSDTEGGTAPKPFDGTIGKAESTTTVKALEISGDVKDATLILNNIAVTGGSNSTDNKTDIKAGATVTLKLEGENTLGTLTVESNASVILKPEADAKLSVTEIKNAGTFIDSTATITKVTGDGALEIAADLSGGGSVTPNTAVTLTSTVNDLAGTTYFIWQQKQADGSYTDVTTNEYNDQGELQTKATTGIIDKYQPATTSVGKAEYRCLVKRVKTTTGGSGGGSSTATTLLSTKSATVEVKSGGNPTPPVPIPTYYTVTLPSVEGFTTKPAAGNHTVEEGYSFSFSLILPEGYTGDAPTVSTSRGETLTPRESDGKYVIRDVTENITVEIAGLPTAKTEMTADDIRIECHAGSVHIHTPSPVATAIYTLTGHRFRQLSLPAGDNRIRLPQGAYIVVAGDKRQKLVVR